MMCLKMPYSGKSWELELLLLQIKLMKIVFLFKWNYILSTQEWKVLIAVVGCPA